MSMQAFIDPSELNQEWRHQNRCIMITSKGLGEHKSGVFPFLRQYHFDMDHDNECADVSNDFEMQAAAVLASFQLHHQPPNPSNQILIPSLPSTAVTSDLATKNHSMPWLHARNLSELSKMTDRMKCSSSERMVSLRKSNTSVNNSTTAALFTNTKVINLCDSSTSSEISHGSDDYRLTTGPKIKTTPASSSETLSSKKIIWYEGSVSLAMDEDEDILSTLHCFMRKYCVEAFSASPKDITTPRYGKAHGGRIVVGQVGIRCLHCHNRRNKTERAVCYPSSLRNIYHSMETWQRRHSYMCPDIPDWNRQEMVKFMTCSRSGAGGRRQYWEDSARKLGMVNTDHGVRFCRPPGVLNEDVHDVEQRDPSNSSVSMASSWSTSPMSPTFPWSSFPVGNKTHHGHCPIVYREDKQLVTDYLFQLMDQMEMCYFSEEDRIGGRSKVKTCPVGFPGMQCKHCMGKAGFGRYFPATLQALALANSDRNIHNHLIKCRKCPQEIQDQLHQLIATNSGGNAVAPKMDKHEGSVVKNKRGSRKAFFELIWNRMHHVITSSDKTCDMHDKNANQIREI